MISEEEKIFPHTEPDAQNYFSGSKPSSSPLVIIIYYIYYYSPCPIVKFKMNYIVFLTRDDYTVRGNGEAQGPQCNTDEMQMINKR